MSRKHKTKPVQTLCGEADEIRLFFGMKQIRSMRKVVFIINSLAGGGAERIMARLVTHSPRKNNELHLVLLDEEPQAYTVPDWVILHRLNTGGSLLAGYFALRRLVGQIKPDNVLSFLTRSNVLAITTRKAGRTRCVISERVHTTSHHTHDLNGVMARALTRLFYPRADALIAVSDGIARDLSDNYAVGASKIVVIPNPIDVAEVRARAAEPGEDIPVPGPLVVAMGRLVPNKNFGMLIDAFGRLNGPGTLLILGEGPLRDELQAQIDAADLADRVHLRGFQANPFATIAAADCFVLPSNGEGFPNGLIEAMILGTPVISTNCHSGPAEILDDRSYFEIAEPTECKYGLLVPTNDPEAMAQALGKALAPGQRQPRSERAIAGASRYGLEATIATYWDVVRGDTRS
jgi:N-acetylgalactosamine-N,N'-diacetylbacillosaminyl-diphospho-undecaprenol 4-alpha-N-acetylgalactosaminyltransferase